MFCVFCVLFEGVKWVWNRVKRRVVVVRVHSALTRATAHSLCVCVCVCVYFIVRMHVFVCVRRRRCDVCAIHCVCV